MLPASCLLLIAVCSWGCSIPNMQSQQCSEASDNVKEFYSWYLGTDAEQRRPEVFKKYVAAGFPTDIPGNDESDPFYLSAKAPTTFKVGKCQIVDDSHSDVQVQLYWRYSDRNTDQREVYADTVKTGDVWQIVKIEDR
jgi:hypothetical protein